MFIFFSVSVNTLYTFAYLLKTDPRPVCVRVLLGLQHRHQQNIELYISSMDQSDTVYSVFVQLCATAGTVSSHEKDAFHHIGIYNLFRKDKNVAIPFTIVPRERDGR